MGSEAADPVGNRTTSSERKKKPVKVPKKIHKAEREKMKRDRINDLFLDLEKALGLEHPNYGKASILRETVRLIGELLSQVDNLETENVALLSESNYVTSERNEVIEETSTLDGQIKKLQKEIGERGSCVIPDILQPTSNDTKHLPENHVPTPLFGHASESTPVLAPLFVMPLHNELEKFPSPEVNMAMSNVSRPRPRYPSSFDIWPSHILAKQKNVTGDA